ncbi:DUF58 domain-containing protein [Jatrophihabitans endophyticus]|uniref:DUF58 domain-containing protein n=1 Tax=Jatrophihabitans endophyticus TaxID=1206085 RepID=UPI0019F50811|nr:DUF58 domain-containing protein [Jatrophihabitans endophyticus]MBE7188053.1 DUF58 domain-containing protein [Jatrophihabitans endophyticus]
MTRFGLATTLAGIGALVLGLLLSWLSFDLVGLGLLAVVVLGLGTVARPSALVVSREIQPPRVPKGSPAIAFLTFANRGRRTVPISVATQAFGDQRVRTVIPKLRGGERGSRAYRLPTRQRGIFDVEPVEIIRRDPFELFRRSRRHAETERIWVYPRIVTLRALPTGLSRTLEGPSSETSPQGNITFHRLRDYVDGDDLRLVHWRSSARAGTLLVKHNVDTSQPFTVVVLDQRTSRYSPPSLEGDTFEEAVDVAASAVVACGANKAPVELRLTDGTVVGGPRLADVTPVVDHLTGVARDDAGTLIDQLTALRRSRGGTSLVVVTGALDPADLPHVAALRRRFERLVVVSVDASERPEGARLRFPGVRLVVARNADDAAAAWNHDAAR